MQQINHTNSAKVPVSVDAAFEYRQETLSEARPAEQHAAALSRAGGSSATYNISPLPESRCFMIGFER